MGSVDVEYYSRRAVQERELALRSERQNVAAIHHELARHYKVLVDRAEQRPRLHIVSADQQAA